MIEKTPQKTFPFFLLAQLSVVGMHKPSSQFQLEHWLKCPRYQAAVSMSLVAIAQQLVVVDVASVGFAYGEMVQKRAHFFSWQGIREVQS